MSRSLPDPAPDWTPDYIRGWRVWSYPDGPRITPNLRSITVQRNWSRTDMPKARCDPTWRKRPHPNDPTPAVACWCGYWALKPHVLDVPHTWIKHIWSMWGVVRHGLAGWVDQWGSIIEHEHGYRSEFIRVNSLIDLDPEWLMAADLTQNEMPKLGLDYYLECLATYHDRVYRAAEYHDVPVVSVHGS